MTDYRTLDVAAMKAITDRFNNREISMYELKRQIFGDVHQRTKEFAETMLRDKTARVANPCHYVHASVYEEAQDATPY